MDVLLLRALVLVSPSLVVHILAVIIGHWPEWRERLQQRKPPP